VDHVDEVARARAVADSLDYRSRTSDETTGQVSSNQL
jgi:hypothetical protein